MMNIVCHSCKQKLMHMTERIVKAPDGYFPLNKENGTDRS